jgi:hypothetical protein
MFSARIRGFKNTQFSGKGPAMLTHHSFPAFRFIVLATCFLHLYLIKNVDFYISRSTHTKALGSKNKRLTSYDNKLK